ncbi:MAG: tryptophan 2,3-dioxygenase [Alphaproteobacteria bacterium]|nr:tryptophan 2,3-dioxygenase [Alphaproteobacteria bacterium]
MSGPHTDFKGEMSYGDYLALDRLLDAQLTRSASHDELLFIIIHQASELWLKLALHELGAATELVKKDELSPAFKMTSRATRIFAQLIQSWDVLSTMTPADYLSFRESLGKSSGFQSYQYRLLEFALGNKDRSLLAPHRHRPEILARLEDALARPSLYDESLRLLARRGLPVAPAVIEREFSESYRPHDSVRAAWVSVYRDPTRYWDLYELAEELLDIEDSFQQWRFRHMTTVKRVIGFRAGTGGTPGVPYLRQRLDHVFFPELWEVRTSL